MRIVFIVLFAAFLTACVRPESAVKSEHYEKIPYLELTQPQHGADFIDKYVQFEAVFFEVLNVKLDLPRQYQNYVRVRVCSPYNQASGSRDTADCDNFFNNIVVPAEKSAAIHGLKQGQKIILRARGVTGGNEFSREDAGRLLLVIDSLEKQ